MAKKLNMAIVKENIAKLNEKKKIEFDDGVYVNIYPDFAMSKVSELLKEVLTDELKATEAGIDFSNVNRGDWLMFNIIKKFSDLVVPGDIKKKIQAFIYLRDSDYFLKLVNEYPEESLKKVQVGIDSANNLLKEMKNLNANQINSIVDNLIPDEK